MLKKTVVATVVATVALIAAPSSALAGGFLIYEQGTRPTGMGGAVVASPFDASAGFYNPAGLAFQRHNKFFGDREGSAGLHSSIDFQAVFPYVEYDPDPGFNGARAESYFRVVPALHGSIDLTENIYIGLSNTHQFGLAVIWPSGWDGRYLNTHAELSADIFNLNLAFRKDFGESVSLAISAGTQVVAPSDFTRARLARKVDFSAVGAPDGAFTFKGHGENFHFGYLLGALLWLRNSGTRIGVHYKSGFDDIYLEGYARINGSPAGNIRVDADTDAELPPIFVAGIAQDFGEHEDGTPYVTAEVDYQHTFWAVFDRLTIKTEGLGIISTEQRWEDEWAIRGGVEIHPIPPLALRLGFIYDRTPIPSDTVSPLLPGNTRYIPTVGVGIQLGPISIELSYMRVFIEKVRKKNFVGSDAGGTVNGNYRGAADLFGFGLRIDM